jgi:type VI secretion system secreted protein VgrG
MEQAGIWYLFNENPLLEEEVSGTPGEEALRITDRPSRFEMLATQPGILYRSQSGLNERIEEEDRESVHRLQQIKQVVPQNVIVKNYNYRTPEVSLTGRKPVRDGAAGTVYDYGGDYKDTAESDRHAAVVADRIACRQLIYDGSGNCPGFRAGKRFTLQEHTRAEFNDTYVLVEVRHHGAHTSSGEGAHVYTYVNNFRGIPSAKADLFRPERTAIVPRMSGVMTATIEAEGSQYAALDDQGRYKVRMPFDMSNTRNYQGSKYLRLSQAYSGANYGVHFPSHEGAEMIFGCIDGDPNKPLGLGTVPNANTISPVVSANKQQGMIRTAGGNELIMDDTDAKQKVTLRSKAVNELLFDDENKVVHLTTTNGNVLKLDDQNECVSWNAEEHVIAMSYKSGEVTITVTSKDGSVIKIDDTNKKIQVQTSGGHGIEMDDNAKTITLKDCQSKNTVTLDGNGGLKLESQGAIEIAAQQDITLRGANVTITANAALEATATSDLKLKGMNLEAKADMNATVDGGMNTEVKAGMQCTLSGMMLSAEGKTTAEYKGGAMTTVKGGIVMIN